MDSAAAAALSSLISTTVLAGTTLLVLRLSPAANLLSWGIAWLLQSGWLAGELVVALRPDAWMVYGPATLLRLASAFFLLRGTFLFLGRRLLWAWWIVYAIAAVWILATWLAGLPALVVSLPSVLVLAGGLIVMGATLLHDAHGRLGVVVLGTSAILLGAHHLGYPLGLAGRIDMFVDFLVLQGLTLVTGTGLLATHQEQTRRLIAESEERFRSLVTSLDDVVMVLDRDGRHVEVYGSWNPDELHTPDDYLGRTAAEVVGEEQGALHLAYHRLAMREGPQRYEYSFEDRSGTRCVEISLAPLCDDEGRIVGTVGVSRDITHLRSTQEELRREVERNRVLLREVHHRSKNNMQVMASILLLQARRVSSPPLQTALTESARRIETMAAVHEHLYATHHLAEVRIDRLAAETAERLARLYSTPGTAVDLDVRAEPIELPIDTALPCAQILQELISNAYRHAFDGRERGSVAVTVRRMDADFVELSVRDDGVGAPPARLEAAEPAVDDPRLGIVLVRILVRQLDGELNFETRGGTHVSVRVPLPAPVESELA